jgi:hypothetical protein
VRSLIKGEFSVDPSPSPSPTGEKAIVHPFSDSFKGKLDVSRPEGEKGGDNTDSRVVLTRVDADGDRLGSGIGRRFE